MGQDEISARFVNWLQNGQGAGSTETGVYDMSLTTPLRSGSASFWIPSENEWYKAAYYQPVAQGGDTDSYWLYPTKSNTAPGNEIGSGANQANFRDGDFATTPGNNTYSGSQNYLTDGGAFIDSASYYGTYDQGGNVFEWNDTVLAGSSRGLRGGSWGTFQNDLLSSVRFSSRAHVGVQLPGFPSCQRPRAVDRARGDRIGRLGLPAEETAESYPLTCRKPLNSIATGPLAAV